MLVVGIVAFLSGVLLVAGEMLVRNSRHREEQESLERDRRELAARLAALESNYPQALVMMDSRGLIRRVNSAAELLFGYDEAELLGHSILRLLPFAPSALNPRATRVTAADGQGAAQMEVRCKDRSTVIVRTTGTRSEFEGRTDIYMFFELVGGGEQRDAGQHTGEQDDADEQPGAGQSQSHRAAANG
jgi:PAS domain S-box-containing protein